MNLRHHEPSVLSCCIRDKQGESRLAHSFFNLIPPNVCSTKTWLVCVTLKIYKVSVGAYRRCSLNRLVVYSWLVGHHRGLCVPHRSAAFPTRAEVTQERLFRSVSHHTNIRCIHSVYHGLNAENVNAKSPRDRTNRYALGSYCADKQFSLFTMFYRIPRRNCNMMHTPAT